MTRLKTDFDWSGSTNLWTTTHTGQLNYDMYDAYIFLQLWVYTMHNKSKNFFLIVPFCIFCSIKFYILLYEIIYLVNSVNLRFEPSKQWTFKAEESCPFAVPCTCRHFSFIYRESIWVDSCFQLQLQSIRRVGISKYSHIIHRCANRCIHFIFV